MVYCISTKLELNTMFIIKLRKKNYKTAGKLTMLKINPQHNVLSRPTKLKTTELLYCVYLELFDYKIYKTKFY